MLQGIIDVHTDDVCSVRAQKPPRPAQKRVLLSFTGIGHTMGGINVQKIEFAGTGRAFDNVLFIADTTRSWGNALDFPALFARLAPFIEGRRLYAVGNSMGGFLSIVATAFAEIDVVVASAPQFSVSRQVMPQETRWQQYTSAIKEFRIPSLEGYFNDTTRYYLLSGDAPKEKPHWSRFPRKDNVRSLVFSGVKHNIAATLKQADVLQPIVRACFEDTLDMDWLNSVSPYPARRV